MTTGFFKRSAGFLARKARTVQHNLSAPAMVRPTLLLQSDDWGRAGMPFNSAVDMLRAAGVALTASPWDLFGLETVADLAALGELLNGQRDADGSAAVMSAVFVMANADLNAIQASGYRQFHAVPIHQGLPPPWPQEPLMAMYRQLIDAGVFYPALHGYTHFNPDLLLALAQENSVRGERLRALHAQGIPYLASLTPEFNFALLDRSGPAERFIGATEQAQWIAHGVSLFQQAFGHQPYSTCAPGYRFNGDTCKLWARAGLQVVHNASGLIGNSDGLWQIPRNVFFEPVLDAKALQTALKAAESAVARGEPIVVCTHSINYVSRHLGRAQEGLAQLAALLGALRQRYPDLRFAQEEQLHQGWLRQDSGWWRAPTRAELLARCAPT